jgi:hypothetical protein
MAIGRGFSRNARWSDYRMPSGPRRSRLCGGGAVAGLRGRAERCRGAHSARRRCTTLLGRLELAVLDAASAGEFNAFEDGSQPGQNPDNEESDSPRVDPPPRVDHCQIKSPPPRLSERRPLACHRSITMCAGGVYLDPFGGMNPAVGDP